MKRLHHAGALHCADINGTFSDEPVRGVEPLSRDDSTPQPESLAPHTFITGTFRSIAVPAFPLHEIAHVRGARA